MNILVTGAAGYIGSVVTEVLIDQGHSVVALDNLQAGHREAVHPNAVFVQADLADTQALDQVFRDHDLDAVVHMAAEALVSVSMSNPRRFFSTNVRGGHESVGRHALSRGQGDHLFLHRRRLWRARGNPD